MESKLTTSQSLNKRYRVNFTIGRKIEKADDKLLPTQSYLLRPRHNNSRVVTIKAGGLNTVSAAAVLSPRGLTPLVMQTADCIPAIAFTPPGQFLALLHLGWQGLFSPLLDNFFAAAARENIKPHELQFIFGPSICRDCYTHHSPLQLAKWWRLRLSRFNQFTHYDKSRTFDLTGAWQAALASHDIAGQRITSVGLCTHHDLNTSFHYQGQTSSKVTTIITTN